MEYVLTSKTYMLLNLESDIIIETRNMEFFKNIARKFQNNGDIMNSRELQEKTSTRYIESES